MAKSNSNNPGINESELRDLERHLQGLSKGLDEPGTFGGNQTEDAEHVRDEIKAIGKNYPQIKKGKVYPKLTQLFDSVRGKAENILNSIGPVAEGAVENVQEVPVEEAAILENEAPETDQGQDLSWKKEARLEFEADPLLNALFLSKAKKLANEAIVEKINELGYRIQSFEDLVKIIHSVLFRELGVEIMPLGGESLENILFDSVNIIEVMGSEDDLDNLKKGIETELQKTLPTPPPPPADAFETEDAVEPIMEIETSEPPAAPTPPSPSMESEPPAAPTPPSPPPPSPPVENVKPVARQVVAPEPQKGKKTPKEKRAEYLEKLALENAPEEFKNWTRLYHALHQKNLRNKPEKTINAIKKNRMIWLGTPDEKSFLQLRAELKKGALRNFIIAKDPIKAMEAIGGVENLDEKSIGLNLAHVIDAIKIEIRGVKQKIAKSEEEQKNETSTVAVIPVPVSAEPTIQAKYISDAKENVRLEPPVKMEMEPKNIPERDRQTIELERSLQFIERTIKKMPSGQKKQEIQRRIARLAGNAGKSEHVPARPEPKGKLEITPTKPGAKEVVEMLMADESLKALIDELDGLRQIMAKRKQIIKFSLNNKAFKDIKDFEKTAKRMESNNDPMIRATTKEELLMEHVEMALRQNPKLLESWDPKFSPEKVVEHFKKTWTQYLDLIKS